MGLVTKRDMDDADKLGASLVNTAEHLEGAWSDARHDVAQAIADGRRDPPRCKGCDEKVYEIAMMAELVAFWAYQAKCYYCYTNDLGKYDDLRPEIQKRIDETFEKVRIEENRERIGHVPDSHDIGS